MAGIAAALYGTTAYILFLGTFLYAIGFISGAPLPKSIDSGAAEPLFASITSSVDMSSGRMTTTPARFARCAITFRGIRLYALDEFATLATIVASDDNSSLGDSAPCFDPKAGHACLCAQILLSTRKEIAR